MNESATIPLYSFKPKARALTIMVPPVVFTVSANPLDKWPLGSALVLGAQANPASTFNPQGPNSGFLDLIYIWHSFSKKAFHSHKIFKNIFDFEYCHTWQDLKVSLAVPCQLLGGGISFLLRGTCEEQTWHQASGVPLKGLDLESQSCRPEPSLVTSSPMWSGPLGTSAFSSVQPLTALSSQRCHEDSMIP